MANSKDRPTREQILDFVSNWKQETEITLLENQITIKILQEKTGKSYDWCKSILREMYLAGLCTLERRSTFSGFINVYTFKEVPTF